MSLFDRLLQAVCTWRRRRGGPKAARNAGINLEQLDHRRLLTVNFTGNVATDFPATQVPGVVVLPNNPLVQHPTISPQIQPIVKVSGFDITGIRVSYSATDDVLSLGLEQPLSLNHSGPVIAGDADNNGNSGTVNPAVTSTPGFAGFQDPPDFGGTENMGAFIDFIGTGEPQIVAGFSQTPPSGPEAKAYQVATAISNGTNAAPNFGTALPQYTGNVFTMNSTAQPNLEFAINNFSQLYKSITGLDLTSSSVINIGAFGGSGQDIGISEAFFPAQPVPIGDATPPVPPTEICSPPILINPHEHRVIDTAHRELVRVYVFGTSGFDVSTIDPSTVSLNGARPVANFIRKFPRNEFPVATYVFVGADINLPPGMTTATLTGSTRDGKTFETSKQVLNIPFSASVPGRLHRLMDSGNSYKGLQRLSTTNPSALTAANSANANAGIGGLGSTVKLNMASRNTAQAMKVNYRSTIANDGIGLTTPVAVPRSVVSLGAANRNAGGQAAANLPRKMSNSLNDFLSQSDLSSLPVSTAKPGVASAV